MLNIPKKGRGLSFAVLNDQAYTRTEGNIPQEDVMQNCIGNGNWGERRIVELNVLAQRLSGCKKCGLPLQLSHALDITTGYLHS